MAKLELRIFISSPGDVGVHRQTVRDAVEHLNNDPLVRDRARLTVVRWDQEGYAIPTSANQTVQWSINDYLPRPSACDLTIALFWSRIGTPLPPSIQRADGSTYASGTVWEVEDALSNDKPVWIYRKTKAPAIELDDPDLAARQAQFKALNDYLGAARNGDGSINFGVHRFDNDEELRDMIGEHLRWFLGDSLSDAATPVAPEPGRDRTSARLLAPALYPVGPMIRDIEVTHLAEAMAELLDAEPPRTVFASCNNKLEQAREPDDPVQRLSTVMFSTQRGSRYFWDDVLHAAAVQGPRMLAVVLSVIRPDQVEGSAAAELSTLITRINSYV